MTLERQICGDTSKACDEVCRKKREKISKGDTWWWNEEVKEAASKKKDVRKTMSRNSTEENNRSYKRMKNKANKPISKAMREKAEEALAELRNCPNGMLRLVKGLKLIVKKLNEEGV